MPIIIPEDPSVNAVETLRVVTLSAGGRPVEVLNLNSSPGSTTAYFRERGSFTFTPPPPTVQWAKNPRRYGGSRATGATHDNGAVAWTAYVRGATLAAATQNVEALLATIENAARGNYLEWAPAGGQSSFLEIAGPGTWTPTYDPVEFVQTNAMRVALTFPTLPLVRWAPITINDPFDVNTLADYTFDAATSADVSVSSGTLIPAVGAALTVERGARHTARGYDTLEGQATVKATPVTTITGFKAGVRLRASSTTYVEVYVDDNGTNSRLRIDVLLPGRTNRASTNLAARLTSTTPAWVRGRIEGNVVVAEYFSSAPTPMATPTLTTNYTLVAGDAPLNTTAGKAGWSWIPQHASATLDDFDFRLAWRNLTWPRTLSPLDTIPGTAPALCDVTVTTSGGATAPAFALIGWAQPTLTPIAGNMPFGVAVAAGTPPAGTFGPVTSSTNLSSAADANALSGTRLSDATVSGIETYVMSWTVDPTALSADTFDGEVSIEVWLRCSLATSVVSPTAIASITSSDGAAFGGTRYTAEWGSTGYPLVPSGYYQFHRIGTLRLPANPRNRRSMLLTISVRTGFGSTGTALFDYAIFAAAQQRALSPTAKPLDAAYPTFVGGTAEATKTIYSDLSALIASGVNAGMTDHGLGGALVEPVFGANTWLLKMSSGVPNNPLAASAGGNEQLTHAATFGLAVTPRSHMLRSA